MSSLICVPYASDFEVPEIRIGCDVSFLVSMDIVFMVEEAYVHAFVDAAKAPFALQKTVTNLGSYKSGDPVTHSELL